MILKFLLWILRLFAWPWAVRKLGQWSGAPLEISPASNEPPIGKEPRVDGIRMDCDTANTYRIAGFARLSTAKESA